MTFRFLNILLHLWKTWDSFGFILFIFPVTNRSWNTYLPIQTVVIDKATSIYHSFLFSFIFRLVILTQFYQVSSIFESQDSSAITSVCTINCIRSYEHNASSASRSLRHLFYLIIFNRIQRGFHRLSIQILFSKIVLRKYFMATLAN